MTIEDTSKPTSKPTTKPPLVVPASAPTKWWAWWENVQLVVIALILALLIRTFVAEPRFIPSDSMVPTLQVGDRLVIEKLSYRFHPPAAGDIVVFEPPSQLQLLGYGKDQAFIKRVIGTPGQTVQVAEGRVYVDRQPLTEPYIAAPPEYAWGPQQVPDGAVFVMGDNRNNSNDSHVWGFLPQQNIIGRAWVRFWQPGRIGILR
jgi:signal peptidase I